MFTLHGLESPHWEADVSVPIWKMRKYKDLLRCEGLTNGRNGIHLIGSRLPLDRAASPKIKEWSNILHGAWIGVPLQKPSPTPHFKDKSSLSTSQRLPFNFGDNNSTYNPGEPLQGHLILWSIDSLWESGNLLFLFTGCARKANICSQKWGHETDGWKHKAHTLYFKCVDLSQK